MPVRPSIVLASQDAPLLLTGGLLGVDLAEMQRAGPGRPRIIDLIQQGKLKYSARDPQERWQTYNQLVAQVRANGIAYGDCEDLATAASAEMRLDSDRWYGDPGATPHVYRSRPGMLHVVVKSPRFKGLLDPSIAAGMGTEAPPPTDLVDAGIRTGALLGSGGRFR